MSINLNIVWNYVDEHDGNFEEQEQNKYEPLLVLNIASNKN